MGEGVEDTLFPNADNPIEIGAFRYDAKRMGGAPTITASVNYPTCLDDEWMDLVYAELNGEKYFLKQTPTSSKSNEDSRYKHDLELVAERIVLDDAYFYDAVIGDPLENDKPVTNSTKFNFYGSIADFVKRMNASLQYTGIQKVDEDGNVVSGYHVVLDDDVITRDQKQVSFDSAVFSQALQEAYNTFGIPFYFDGQTIHVGFSNNIISDVLEYGVDGALLSATKTNANFKVINRATGNGSSDNIPYYYPNEAPKGEIEVFSSGSLAVDDIEITNKELFNELRVDQVYTFAGDSSLNQYSLKAINPTTKEDFPFSDNKATVTRVEIEKNVAEIEVEYQLFFDSFAESNVKIEWALSNPTNPAINMTPPLKTAWGKDQLEFEVTDITFVQNGNEEKIGFTPITAKHQYYSNVFYRSGQTSTGIVSNKLIQTGVEFSTPNTQGQATVVIYGRLKTLGDFWSSVPDYFWGQGSKKVPHSDIAFSASVLTHTTGGWRKEDGTDINMNNYGVSFLKEPQFGDSFGYHIVKYVNVSSTLQPSIYRATDGKERFYNAINYPFAFVDGYELKYGEYVLDGEVHNDAYKKDDGTYYEFTNEYKEGRPREHVFTVDDIKPTIKEMTNNISWVETDENGESKTVFQRIDMFSEFAYNIGDNDETYTDPDGNTSFKHPYFFGKLRKLDFNLFDSASEMGEMTFSMTSGRHHRRSYL